MARQSAPMNCSEAEILELQGLAEHGKNQTVRKRAAAMLACAEGAQIKDVAAQFGVRPGTVIDWKKKYLASGADRLKKNLPRGNSKDVYGAEFEARLLRAVNSAPPEGEKYWTGRLLAKHLDVKEEVVRRYLHKAGIYLNELRIRNEQDAEKADSSTTTNVPNSLEQSDSQEAVSRSDGGDVQAEKEPDRTCTGNERPRLDLGIKLLVRDKHGNIREIATAFENDAFVDSDHFDISTFEGFRTDLADLERALIKVVGSGQLSFVDNFFSETSKKKTMTEPDIERRLRKVRSEIGSFKLVTVGELAMGLSPKEIIVSKGQEEVEEIMCTNAGGAYRVVEHALNRIQHRCKFSKVTHRGLQRLMEKLGKKETNAELAYAEAILDKAGIDPKTLLRKPDGVLDKYIKLPHKTLSEAELSKLTCMVEKYNFERKNVIKIKNKKYWGRIEGLPKRVIICSIDEIGVKRQKEKRAVHGNKGFKSAERVENAVIHVQIGKKKYIITQSNLFDAFKVFVALALENGLQEGVPVVFFCDGAKNIRAIIDKYFAFYPHFTFLDWYHLKKKLREFVASAFKGTKEEKRKIHNELMSQLWAGNVEEAQAYIESLCPQLVRSQAVLADMKKYLENKEPNLYCYALRKELGLRNASSPVEKANDRVVARRQKHNGMSWSCQGSGALAILTARRLNAGHGLKWRSTYHSKSA